MHHPTGMGHSTAHHYNSVAAHMHSYLHGPMQQSPYFDAASQMFLQYGAQRMGINPMVANEIGGLARQFMHHVLS
jgi:hypothetical protein